MSNLGLLIQGVGAAWAMTEQGAGPSMVALVQTAAMLPVLLLAIPAGAMADMHDRRIVSLFALSISVLSVSALFLLSICSVVSPILLLTFCFSVGCGTALFWPAWQSSAAEHVPAESLPAAVALNSISFNVARSLGPAIGGVIVAAAGAVAAFATSAVLYLPMLAVLLFSSGTHRPSALPPERLNRALISGLRYVAHSPAIRVVIGRAWIMGLLGGSVTALLPLISRDLLHAKADVFGLLLGSYGAGAVIGAFAVAPVRARFGSENAVRGCLAIFGVATFVIAESRDELLTSVALVVAGVGWMLAMTTFNIGMQVPVPRWVAGRALATFQASVAGGIAIGSWGWGLLADGRSVSTALAVSAGGTLASGLLGLLWRLPDVDGESAQSSTQIPEPDVEFALTASSGPIVVALEYRVAAKDADAFEGIMLEIRRVRQRNGAYSWSLAKDLADSELWVERYRCPTWLDFLRQRDRHTQAERELQARAEALQLAGIPVRIRRLIERS